MHVPLGIAVTEFLAETQMPAIAHHHDFIGSGRFSVGAVKDYLTWLFRLICPICITHHQPGRH